MHMSAHSRRAKENEEESVTLIALIVEGNCVLDLCLKRYSNVSGQSKTSEVFSVLMALSQTILA